MVFTNSAEEGLFSLVVVMMGGGEVQLSIRDFPIPLWNVVGEVFRFSKQTRAKQSDRHRES